MLIFAVPPFTNQLTPSNQSHVEKINNQKLIYIDHVVVVGLILKAMHFLQELKAERGDAKSHTLDEETIKDDVSGEIPWGQGACDPTPGA